MLHALQTRPPAERPPARASDAEAPGAGPDAVLRCRACGRAIARRAHAIAVQGAHEHVLVNPHGHDFRVGLFAQAPGGRAVGPASAFYSWFPGYAWRVLVCGGCEVHLGWSYGAPAAFFGLVLDHLSEGPDE